MPNLTYTIANSEMNLFSNSALNAGGMVLDFFTPVKEFHPKEKTAIFSFPKEATEKIGEEGEYTHQENFTFFSVLNEVVIKDLSQKPKTLWGIFPGLEIDEKEIDEAKKSLFAAGI